MKRLKTALVALLALTTLSLGVRAQDNGQKPTVIKGEAGNLLVFEQFSGFNDVFLSANNRYFVMRAGSAEESGYSAVYDIETDTVLDYGECYIVGYLNPQNYVTSTYAVINGQIVDNYMGLQSRYKSWVVDGADSTCRYIKARTTIGEAYVDVFIDILGNGGEGRVTDTLQHYKPELMHAGYGSRALGWSNDFKVLAGRTSFPDTAFSNFSPAFWDRELGRIYYVGGRDVGVNTDGTLYACNNDGSIIVGEVSDHAYYFLYNRAERSFTKHKIPEDLGYESSWIFAVSETGKLIGIEQIMPQDIYSREGFIYNHNTGEKHNLVEYLKNLYGLDALSYLPSLFSPGEISDNGLIIGGHSYIDAAYLPYLLILDEHPLHAKVRNLNVWQVYNSESVSLQWKAPIVEEYVLKGYNIYRDSVKVNNELLAASATTYTEYGVKEGLYIYTVEAVFEDGETSQCSSEAIKIIPIGGCLPVQRIRDEVLYNKTVTLRWGLPSAQSAQKASADKAADAPKRTENDAVVLGGDNLRDNSLDNSRDGLQDGEAKSYTPTEDQLDITDINSTGITSASSVLHIGNYYYVGQYLSATFYVYDDRNWELVKTISVDGLSGVYDMTGHDNTIYVVGGKSKVFELSLNEDDPFDLSVSNNWETLYTKNTNIAYVENNDGEDYLLVGDWDGFTAYPLNPENKTDTLDTEVRFELNGATISGTEAHNGYLYVANQHGANTTNIEVYDMATGKRLSTTDLYADPDLYTASSNGYGAIGGLTLDKWEDGTVVLQSLVQTYYWYNLQVGVEIESSTETLGYNIYRNGEKINTEIIKARHFVEDLEPGKYGYVVEYLSTRCSSRSDDEGTGVTDSVEIFERGNCNAPQSLTAIESNNMAILTWNLTETGTDASLVGFNIYRNDELIEKELLDLKYYDTEVKAGDYIYRVEAYYDNSCIAAEEVEISISFEGNAQAPSLVKGSARKNSDGEWQADISWDLPYFEEPMSLGYCNQPAGHTAFENTSQTYGMIGWDSSDMANFDDLYLIGEEFFFQEDRFNSINGIVYIDDARVYNEPIIDRIRPGDWTRVFFNKTFPMKQKMEIAVGYGLTYDPNVVENGTLVYDMGPGNRGRSDIVSPDGNSWYYLADNDLDVNLCINALVVRKRDLEEAKNAENPDEYLKSKVMSLNKALLSGGQPIAKAPKSTSESFTLQGFNIYKDGDKLNGELLTGFAYTDNEVEAGEEYEYAVSAVYAQGIEKESEPIYLEIKDESANEELRAAGLRLYPNPAGAVVHIDGEYTSLMVMDIAGRVVMDGIRGQKSVSLQGLNQGVYFFNFVSASGRNVAVKVVKR